MAKISTYNFDSTVHKTDKVIGTDSSGGTKNYSLEIIGDFFKDTNTASGGPQLTFKYDTSIGQASGYLDSPSVTNLETASTRTIRISTFTFGDPNNTKADFIQALLNKDVIIANVDNINNFGIFNITNITTDGNFKTLSLSAPISSKGNFIDGEVYAIAPSGGIGAGDLTAVTTNTSNQLTISNGTGPVPNLDIVTGTVASNGTGLSTQAQIKTYVDSQITAQDLDFQGDSGGALNIDLDSETLTITGGSGVSTAGSGNTITVNVDHDAITNFVSNEHIDHTAVSITAGNGLIGGGTIAANRTINIGEGTGITVSADAISTNDSEIVHDNLSGFVANEHIDHSAVTLTAGTGLSGGGDITANRTFNLADTSVTAGSYGSATAIPTFTVDAQGRLTAAGTASISTSFTISDGSGTDLVNTSETLSFIGTANEIETAVTNNQVQIGIVTNPTLTGNTTVTGNINFGDSHFIGDDSFDNLHILASGGENVVIQAPSGNSIDLKTAGGSTLNLNSSQDATFAGDVSIAEKLIHSGDTNTYLQFPGTNDKIVFATNGSDVLTLDAANTATFAGDLLVNTSGGYFQVDVSDNSTKHADNTKAKFGTGNDLEIFHDGNSVIRNQTGDLFIDNYADDSDIKFRSDDGSGSQTEYFRLDGGLGYTVVNKTINFTDSVPATFGNASDLEIFHDGTNNFIRSVSSNLYIKNELDDGDIRFESDDGSGNIAEYFRLDGGEVITKYFKDIKLLDNVNLLIGSGTDLQLYHTGSISYIRNNTGNLEIRNQTSGASDILLKSTTANGLETFITLDGSLGYTTSSQHIQMTDGRAYYAGLGNDLGIFHNGSISKIENLNGNLVIEQFADDSDIVFKADDGSGGTTEYFKLDGGLVLNEFSQHTRAIDNKFLGVGNSTDLYMVHDGTNSHIRNGTGNLTIEQQVDDGDIIFKSDNGSGGTTEYFRLYGSGLNVLVSKEFRFYDSVKAVFGNSADLQIYHDGSNSYIRDAGTGDLYIESASNFFLRDQTNGQVWISAASTGVGLRYQDNQKLITTSSGVTITGNLVMGGGQVKFADNGKLMLGDSNDLQIYHNSNDSYIADTGTGSLKILAQNFDLKNAANSASMVRAIDGSQVELYFGGSKKLETTSSGIDVAGNVLLEGSAPFVEIKTTQTGTPDWKIYNSYNTVGDFAIVGGSSVSNKFNIQPNGNVGIGIDNPSVKLAIKSAQDSSFDEGIGVIRSNTSQTGYINMVGGAMNINAPNAIPIKFRDGGNTNLTIGGDGHATFAGDVTITGNLILNGTTTTINTQTVEVEDNILQLNTTQGSPDTATATTSGISVYRGDGVTQASFIFDDADDTWDLTNNLVVAGDLKVNGGTNGITVDSAGHASLNLDRASTGYDNNLIYRTNGAIKWRIWQDGSSDFLYIRDEANSSNMVSFQTGGNTTFTGNVTANGDGSFGTSGATNNSSVKTLDGSIITKIQSQTAGDTAGILGTESNNVLRLVTNNISALTIDTSQNVGIGTTGPSAKFEVKAKGSALGSTGYFINSLFKDIGQNVGIVTAHNDTDNGVGVIAGINSLAFVTYGSDWTQALLLDTSQNATFAGNVSLADGKNLNIGTGNDLFFVHNGTNSFIQNANGDFYIEQASNDRDIIFRNDNGSGGLAEYFRLDGGEAINVFSRKARFLDNVQATFGTADDFKISHDGSGTYVQNVTSHLIIENQANDSDIIFKSDNGSGGIVEYFKLDGSHTRTTFAKDIKLEDNVKILGGTGEDLKIYHDGSNSYIQDTSGTGDLIIDTNAFRLRSANGGESMITAFEDGAVNLMHNSFTKLSTTSTGVSVTGGATFAGQVEVSLASNQIKLSTGTAGDGYLNIGHFSNGTFIGTYGDDGGAADLIRFGTHSGDERMRIDSSGNVGIGIAPVSGARLTLGTGAVANEILSFASATGGNAELRNTSSTGSFTFTNSNGSSEKMRITSAGKVGIGTTNPGGELHIVGAAGGAAQLYLSDADNGTGTGDGFLITKSGTNAFVYNRDDGQISFGTNDTSNMLVIANTGNATFAGNVSLADSKKIKLGAGEDLTLVHNSTNSFLTNDTGDLYIRNNANDKDIIFQSDDGSGGLAEYIRIDGSAVKTTINKEMQFFDTIKASFGSAADLQIYHDGSNSYIQEQGTGILKILSNGVGIKNAGDSGFMAFFGATGASELYFNTAKKFETTSTGVSISSTGAGAIATVEAGDANQASLDLKNTEGHYRLITDGGELKVFDQTDSRTPFLIDTSGNATFAGQASAKGLRVTTRGTASAETWNTSDGDGIFFDFYNDGNPYLRHGSIIANSADGSAAQLEFYTTPASGSGTLALTLDLSQNAIFSGNIGLGGATSPSRLLHIDNTSSAATASAYFYTNAQHTGSTTQAHVSIYSDHASSTGQTLFVRGDGTGDLLVLNKGGANKLVVDDDGNATFAGAVTVEGGQLHLGKADTASGHINAKELMTFNIDTDNDDTTRYFAWYTNGEDGSGTELLKILETGNATFAGDVEIHNEGNDTTGKLTISGNNNTGTPGQKTSGTIEHRGEHLKTVITHNGSDIITIGTGTQTTFAGDVQAPGIYVGSTNTSFDFYNNGTTYLNGAVTIDHNLDITSNGVIRMGGTEVISATRGISASTGTFTGDVTVESEHLTLKGSSPEFYFHTTGNHVNWLIAAQESTNATLEFSAVAASTSLSTDASTYTPVLKLAQSGDATFAGSVGIGKTPSQWMLDIDSTNAYIGSFDGSGNTGVVLNSNNSTAAQIIGYSNSASTYNDLDIRANSTAGSGVYIDGSTSRVGIGTTSPASSLEVAGNIQTTGTTTISALYDSNHYIRLESNSSGGVLKGTDGGVVTILARSYGDSYFNGGNFGIGTTSPATGYKLQVKRDTNVNIGFGLQNSGASLEAVNDAVNANIPFSLYGSKILLLNGNVGIGTTSPSHNLQIGTAATNGSYSMMIEGNFANNALASNPRINLIDTNFGITAGKYGSGDSDDALGIFAYQGIGRGIVFAHTTAGVTTHLKDMRQDMFIDGGTGKVGIGTTSPGTKLSLEDSAANGAVQISFKNDAREWRTGVHGGISDSFTLYDNTASATRLVVDSSGNVGIGVIPKSWGTNGDTRAIQISTMTSLSEAFDGTQLASNFYFNGTNDKYIESDFATAYLQIDGTHRFRIAASGTADANITWSEAMRIDSSGAVGIGVSPESNRFASHDVLQVGARATLLANDTVSLTGQTALLDNLYYDSSGNFQHRGNSAGAMVQMYQGNIIFQNSNQTSGTPTVTERMRITSGGTGTFYNAFNIQGDDKSLIVRNAAGTVIGTMGAESSSTPNVGMTTIRNNGTTTIQFNSNGSSYINSGNVGIGTTSPRTKLNVQSSAGASSYTGSGPGDLIRASGSGAGNWIASDDDGAMAYFGIDSGRGKFAAFNYATSTEMHMILGQNRMFIKNNGNVGIGTTSPASKLEVDGNIQSDTTSIANSAAYIRGADVGIGIGQSASSPYGSWIQARRNTDGVAFPISLNPSGGNVGIGNTSPSQKLHVTGSILASSDVVAFSDKKLKENIKTLDGSKVYDMRGVSFTRKDTGKDSSGVIAQEIQKIAPELVTDNDGTLSVAYGNLTGYLIEAVKELKAEIKELKKQIK